MEHESGLMDNQADANNKSHNKKTTDLTHKSTISESIDIDLSKLEANEESLKPYTLSKQFLKIDLDKIRDIIEILEEYCFSLVQKEDINLAKTAKQRLILLKKIEKEKMMMEAKIIYSNQLELVEDKMKEDLDTYLSNSETEFKNLMERFNEQEKEMDKINKEELDLFKQNFEQMYSQLKPKPSKECLNWMKIKNYALRQNKFNKAQEANTEIEKLIYKDNIKFNENKQKKLDIEIKKIKRRHDNEKKVFEMKKNIIITEFNENKEKEINKIKKKYISKISELKNYQNFEISNFDKITKGVIKPCSRIQNIVSSATGIKEEDEEENKKENTIEENKGDETKENKEEENLENNDKEKDIENDKENEENNEENNEEDIKQNDLEENEEENNDEEDNGEEYINKEE
jgi:hypothetical protein